MGILASPIQKFLYSFARRSIGVPFRYALNIVLPKHPVVVPLLPPLAGHRMRVDLQSQKAFVMGTYEPTVCRALHKVVQPGWTVVDLGAHIGYMTLLLAKLVGPHGRVFAFEPMPDNFSVLCENVRLNRYRNVVAEPKAVTDACGSVTLYVPEERYSSQGSLLTKRGKPCLVEGISLDSYWDKLGDFALHLIKIDIEGAEDAAIEGMVKLLRRWRPVMVVEVHACNDGAPSHCLERLKALGYRLRALDSATWCEVNTTARGH
ncbi:MAG: FkbM family methyltransferase [Anaerolineales bacterium]|nr:MAG: FkbM family methyltransferase [Anaerolineales bacterium]